MRRAALMLIFCAACIWGCRTVRPVSEPGTTGSPEAAGAHTGKSQGIDFADQSTWVLGYFNIGRLKQPPHSEWFYKGYDEYMPQREFMDRLSAISKDDLSIRIVMGSWCPDSRREVPRFMKIIDTWEFPAGMLTFIGVDIGKLSPVGGYEELEIQRVPTFIFYKNNIEAGRIIENPMTSLEQDMVNILEGMNSNK